MVMTNITINRVLEAIVKGNYSGKAISDYTGINKSNLSRYLHFLENIDFIYLSVNKKRSLLYSLRYYNQIKFSQDSIQNFHIHLFILNLMRYISLALIFSCSNHF